MPRLFRAALAALSLVAALGLPATTNAAPATKVAIIVGPVGSLTPSYLAYAEAAAGVAEQHGAVVARAYSPNATPANVLAAVADAHIVIYFGHGYGFPSPYGGLDTARQNGWGLQGPRAHGTHGDGLDGEIEYVGEDWIVANARPAPGFVMIYSNTCYAPGASEGGFAPATPFEAAQRVAHYSRKVFAMGGSAYYATDFDLGAADLLGRLLGNRGGTFGSAFASDYRFDPSALTSQAHPLAAGQTIWLHRSKYAKGPPNYWYAFAGNPDLSPLLAWDRTAPVATLSSPATEADPDAPISLRLSEPVTGISASSLSLRDGAGQIVATTVTYDAASRLATVRPEVPLVLSSRYSVVAGDEIVDAAGRRLATATWAVSTALDSDPLTAELSIVLEAGDHVLLRFHADGSEAERLVLDVVDRRWILADRRARLQDRHGSWLRLADASLGGWWVAESSRAHALGQVEEAALSKGTRIVLPPVEHALHTWDSNVPSPGGEMSVAAGRTVSVDRRRIFDGRTFLRLADTEFAGAWIEANPAVTPTESAARRILAIESRAVEARLSPAPGELVAFKFDADGRVSGRRLVTDVDVETLVLTTAETRDVAGARFAVIASGELAGWALAEGPDLRITPVTRAPETAG